MLERPPALDWPRCNRCDRCRGRRGARSGRPVARTRRPSERRRRPDRGRGGGHRWGGDDGHRLGTPGHGGGSRRTRPHRRPSPTRRPPPPPTRRAYEISGTGSVPWHPSIRLNGTGRARPTYSQRRMWVPDPAIRTQRDGESPGGVFVDSLRKEADVTKEVDRGNDEVTDAHGFGGTGGGPDHHCLATERRRPRPACDAQGGRGPRSS